MGQAASDRSCRVVVVVGNPRAGSRTLHFATAIADQLRLRLGVAADSMTVIDLALVADTVFDFSDANVNGLVDQVTSADLIVVASPVYKASYTGLLKAFFDRFGPDALAGAAAIPVMVGAGLQHALAGEVFLRPLLVELGASVPGPVLYALDTDLDVQSTRTAAWLDRICATVQRKRT